MQSIIDLSPPPPCPEPFNLTAHVLAKAENDPDKIALAILGLSGAERWSYGKLNRTVLGLAGALAEMNLPSGARILMRLGNSVEFPLAFLAAIAAGYVPIPTSSQLTTREINKISEEVQPSLIFAGEGIALPDPLPCPSLSEAELHEMGTHAPISPVMGPADRPAYIIFTSGTSGQARGVIHAHRAVWARQMMMQGWYGLTPQDRLLHAGAFNWTFTLGTGLLDPWTMGATALIPADGTTPDQLPLLLKRHDASIFAAAPGVYRQMLKRPLPALPKIRHGLAAGEKLAPTIRETWEKATGTRIHEAFGMSECSTFISGSPKHPSPDGSLGFAQPGRKLAILNEAGEITPQGDPGVIAVDAKDPGLMLGYLNAPQDTEARYSPDKNWFLTGDMGEMSSDGAISYLGRDDDMLNAGGFRVSPLEIETALLIHPEIDEAAAVELRVRKDASIIALFYTSDMPLSEENLAEFASNQLARYKTPRLFLHKASLPRSANGKLQRKTLRAEYEAQNDPV